MINEQKIKVFLSLAESLSFTATANSMFISQQAVSKHISQLEEALGFRLFVRSTHAVKLTSAGERAKDFFGEQYKSFTAYIEEERKKAERQKKSLHIGYNNWLNLGNAIGVARMLFQQRHPSISHVPERLPPDELINKLLDEELDIILVLQRYLGNEAGIKTVSLAKFPLSIIVSRQNCIPCVPTLEQLSEMPLLINAFSRESFSDAKKRAQKEACPLGLTNESIVVTRNRDSVYTAVETGEGIAIACSFSQISNNIARIPTESSDMLVAACLEKNQRKLVEQYMNCLKDAYRNHGTNRK